MSNKQDLLKIYEDYLIELNKERKLKLRLRK